MDLMCSPAAKSRSGMTQRWIRLRLEQDLVDRLNATILGTAFLIWGRIGQTDILYVCSMPLATNTTRFGDKGLIC